MFFSGLRNYRILIETTPAPETIAKPYNNDYFDVESC